MRQNYAAFAVEEPAPKAAIDAKLTGYVFLTCVVAASGWILFGEPALIVMRGNRRLRMVKFHQA